MFKTFSYLALSSLSFNLFAYSAICDTQDGKQFHINVQDKVMKIDQKYSAFYKGRDDEGFYIYSNKGYTYSAGRFNGDVFPIKVKNKWGLNTSGSCKLQ